MSQQTIVETHNQPTTLLICGGRDFGDYDYFQKSLNELRMQGVFDGVTRVVAGGAPGADTMAERWAQENGYDVKRVPAEWHLYGNRAGPMRNTAMIALADLVVAFPTAASRGTYDTVNKARKKGIPVHVYTV